MEWIILFALLSGVGNFWQYGNNQSLEAELDLANREASACQAVQEASRATDIEAANERERTSTASERILSGSEYNAGSINQVGPNLCGTTINPTASRKIDVIIKRTRALNNAWLRIPGESDDR